MYITNTYNAWWCRFFYLIDKKNKNKYRIEINNNKKIYISAKKIDTKRICVAGMQYVEYKYKIRNNGNIYFYHNPRTVYFNNKDENYIDNWYNREEKIIYAVPQYLWAKMLAISNGL